MCESRAPTAAAAEAPTPAAEESASRAAVPPVAPSPSKTAEGPSHWYGGAALVADGVSLGLMVSGVVAKNESMLFVGGAGYALGGPIAHLINGHPSRAAASVGIRVLGGGLATGSVLMDILSHPCDGEPSCRHYPSAGFALAAVALLAAGAVDDVWLAQESASARPERASVGAAIALDRKLAFLSLSGRF